MSVGELPDDKDLRQLRNVPGRYVVLAASAIGIPAAGAMLARLLTNTFVGDIGTSLPVNIGTAVGFGVGYVGFMALKHRFFVTNSTTGILLTTDGLKALFSRDDIFVAYGPGGPFVSYPWEQRSAENNISVKTATVEFGPFDVQCKDGTVTVKGSARLRPDHKNPRRFQTGAASVAADLTDLILAFLIGEIGSMKIADAMKKVSNLNKMLLSEFVMRDPAKPNEPTDFEKEHGIFVVDVTISQVLPSKEVQRTMSGLTETRFIAEGTRILLNYTSAKAVKEALASGQLSRADYNHARDRVMSISGNMEGVNVTRYEIDLNASGIEKDTAEALGALLRNTPPQVLAGLVASATKGTKSK